MLSASDYSECAARLKILVDRDRLRIINCLLEGPQNVSQMARALDMRIVKISHHLGILRDAEFVQAKKQGRFVIYSIRPETLVCPEQLGTGRTIDLGCCQLTVAPGMIP